MVSRESGAMDIDTLPLTHSTLGRRCRIALLLRDASKTGDEASDRLTQECIRGKGFISRVGFELDSCFIPGHFGGYPSELLAKHV